MAEGTALAAGGPPNLWRRLRPALVSTGVILPAGLALNYALNVVLARVLPVAGYGLFAYTQSLAAILSLAAALGFSTSMMRFVATYRIQGQQALLRGLVRSSLRLILLASALIALLLLALGWVFPAQRSGLFWVAMLLMPLTVDVWRESTMLGLHRAGAAILPRQILLPGLTLACVGALSLTDAEAVMLAFFALLVLLELGGLWQLRSALALPKELHPVTRIRDWLRTSLPMAGANLATQGMMRWDVVVLGALLGLEAVGPYAAAARTALLASLVLRVVNLVVGPMLAELYHSGDLRRFRRLLLAASLGAGAAGLPLYMLVLLRPEWVLGLFGPAYAEAALPLQILATGQFVNLVTGPVGLALTMSVHEAANLRLSLAASLGSLVALILLVPIYGAGGAALAVGGAVALLNVAMVVLAWRYFR